MNTDTYTGEPRRSASGVAMASDGGRALEGKTALVTGGGAVVAVSSIAGVLTHRLMAPYSVSKAALDMLVRNFADELGPYGIRVNGVRPGLVPTETSDPLASHEATRSDYLAQMPLGRLGT